MFVVELDGLGDRLVEARCREPKLQHRSRDMPSQSSRLRPHEEAVGIVEHVDTLATNCAS